MKILGLKLGGIGRFGDDVTVPLSDLGESALVAVIGGNGEGKTTLLEAIPGALYRTTPSRGAIAGLANRRDSHVELDVEVGGERYTCRLVMDGVGRTAKTEAYLLDAAGKPLTDGKVRTYEEAVARLFPAQGVFLSSAFAAQGKEGSFLSMPAARRKELFADLLGLGRLQEQSEAAGEKAREVESSIAGLRGRHEALASQAASKDALLQEQTAAQATHEAIQHERAAAEEEVNAHQERMERWHSVAADLERAVANASQAVATARHDRAQVEAEFNRARTAIRDAEDEQLPLVKRLAERPGLEEELDRSNPAGRLAQLEPQIASMREAMTAHQETVRAWREKRDVLRDRAQSLREAHKHEEQAHKSAMAEWEWEQATLKERYAAAADAIASAERQASALGRVPCGGNGEFAACGLIAGAAQARAKLPELEAAAAESLAAARAHADRKPVAPSDKARLAFETAQAELWAVGDEPTAPGLEELRALEIEADRCRVIMTRHAEIRAKIDALAEAEQRSARLAEQIDRLRDAASKANGALARATSNLSTVDGIRRQAEEARTKHDAIRPRAPDAAALEGLRRREAQAAAEVARLQEAVRVASEAETRAAEVQALIDAQLADLDDWRHLQQALGRSGIQALEIDASGPEVSDLCNQLLHACYGSRFSVSLETAVLKADGKGTKEVFDLRVIDSERGTEGSADHLSGGEKVLVGEALALAIAIYNARRSSVPMLDLFRDECSGALSQANAYRYVEMLRRALALGGFHRCYFVAHQPELWPLADARLLVEGGTVRVADAEEITVGARVREESEAA